LSGAVVTTLDDAWVVAALATPAEAPMATIGATQTAAASRLIFDTCMMFPLFPGVEVRVSQCVFMELDASYHQNYG
jgi:hypothetical protein